MDDIELYDDDDEDNLFVSFKTSVRVIRVIDKELIPTKIRLRVDFANEEGPDPDDQFSILSSQAGMARIRYWLSNRFEDSLLISSENDWALEALSETANRHTTLPGEPTEDVLVMVLQSKLQALGGKHVMIGNLDLEIQDGHGLAFTYVGDGELELPTQEEWMADLAFFDKPWWARCDGWTSDPMDPKKLPPMLLEDGTDLIDRTEPDADSLDFIAAEIFNNSSHTAEILRPQFKPQIIQGSKED